MSSEQGKDTSDSGRKSDPYMGTTILLRRLSARECGLITVDAKVVGSKVPSDGSLYLSTLGKVLVSLEL